MQALYRARCTADSAIYSSNHDRRSSALESCRAARNIPIATPGHNRSPIVSFYIRQPSADATKVLDADRVRVSLQDVPATAASPALTRVRVAVAFYNSESDVDRLLATAAKLIA